MKRQALDHTKMDLLMRRLKIRRCVAVGILESLWHLTAREAPRGDIGKLSNDRIAIGIDWGGDPDRLVAALIDTGWIDSDGDEWQSGGQQRLLIHDWKDHCDESVKKYLKRNGIEFACRDMSRNVLDMSRLPEDQKTGRPVPDNQKPAPTPIRPRDSPSDAEISEAAQSMYALHPKKKDAPLVPESLVKAVARGHSLHRIQEVHAAFCKSKDWRKDGGRYAPKLAMWLTDDGFTGWPADIPKPAPPIDESKIIPCVLVPPPEEEFRLGLYDSPTQ